MELKILSQTNTELGKQKLPKQFKEALRPDVIKRAFLSIQNEERQPYGSDPRAGLRASADLSRKRKDYRGSYGHGISRVPRKILTRRGTRFNWVGAEVPGTVGGRRAHPPKSDKIWTQKVNKKEKKLAIRSAISATLNKELVQGKGHKVPENYPFIIEDKFESLDKTKTVRDTLNKLGLDKELARSNQKIIRAGKGKARGRKYRRKTGILIVVSDNCNIQKAAKNIPGIDVAKVNELNITLLAPGADAGRITLFTQAAVLKIEKEKLFM